MTMITMIMIKIMMMMITMVMMRVINCYDDDEKKDEDN